MEAQIYSCTLCGKQGEVAFRVNMRRPDKIARATEDTPKPLCLRCAEEEQKRIVAEIAAKDKPVAAKVEKKPKRPRKQPPDPTDVALNWRWIAFGDPPSWTKRRPVIAGHYWVWAEGDLEPILRKVGDANSTMNALENKTWFLGPCRVPPSPEQAKAVPAGVYRADAPTSPAEER